MKNAVTRVLAAAAALTLFATLPALPAFAAPEATGIAVGEMRVNDTLTPLGLDDTRPALSWKLTADTQSVEQSAYEVRVASDPDLLDDGTGDIWSSGKVDSARSVQVDYNGAALESAKRYYWKVRVWDQHDVASDWSASSWWEMALLNSADWAGSEWISPAGENLVWDDFEISSDFRLWKKAGGIVFRATGTDNMNMWQVNPEQTIPRLRQHIWRDGRVVANREVNIPAAVMAPGEPDGVTHTLRIRAEGSTYTSWIDGMLVDTWTVSAAELNASGVIGFRGGDNRPGNEHSSAWSNVTVTELDGTPIWADDFDNGPSAYFKGAIIENGALMRRNNEVVLISAAGNEAPLLRTEFTLDKPVASARAYAYGLGWYELSMNGEKADDRVLAPSATPFSQRNLYQTYDVTDLLAEGENAVGVWLANGYGEGYSEWGWRWDGPRQAIITIRVTHTDGSVTVIGSDDSWTSHASAVTSAHIYNGESYDARSEIAGWANPGLDDSTWTGVRVVDAPSARLEADEMPQIRVHTDFAPIAVFEPTPNVYVFDFGQNMAGWTRLNDLDVAAGTKITIRHAERVDENGALDTHTNRSAAATDQYIAAGTGSETWEPRFTYHGFRYAEVTGLSEAPSVTARAVHADLQETGTFESSDSMLNKIFENNRWTILNNFMSYPTDTPVRDERTPPQMDVQAHQDAAIRTLNMSTYFDKYLNDLPGARQGTTYAGDTTMFGIHIPLALALYKEYGTTQVLEEHWGDVRSRADWLLANHPDGVWPSTGGSHGDSGRYGDWCAPIPVEAANGGLGDWNAGACFSEPNLVTSVLQYRHIVEASEIAAILGHENDAARYVAAAATIKDAVNLKYLNADGSYASGRQTTSILPLVFGMVPDDRFEQVADYFIDRVERVNDGHLDTGIFGTRYLIDALTLVGRSDLAYGTMTQTTYPSFGYQILEHDATTAWEGWTLRSGMQTYDHAMFIGPNSSFLTEFGGIRSTTAGYETLTIDPQIPAGLQSATARMETVRGLVSSSWEQSDSDLRLAVTVPVNSRATVVVPVKADEVVATPAGAEQLSVSASEYTFAVGSGDYEFRAAVPEADITAPVVSLDIEGEGDGGWLRAATATLSAVDEPGGSGVAVIEYAIGNGSWTRFDAPIALAEGQYTLRYRARDEAGNVSQAGQRQIRIDSTTPTVWGWLDDAGTVTSVARDRASGVSAVEYSSDGEEWRVSPSGFATAESVMVRARDRAGNTTSRALTPSSNATTLDVAAGDYLHIARSGFSVGAGVRVELHSTPTVLGRVTADSVGVISLNAPVPTTLQDGSHRLLFITDGGETIEIPVDTLAETGAGAVMGGALLALLALGFGGVLLLRRRSRLVPLR
ncbi:family 78 glycoside hydrolase catalytic domain [Glaciibacter psychrotolerans]|uniref:alpha-L-rhamnosidase n=1 Tax=Glaciibacter psychrotolerans TaxID=670054 RepID=A0A7Z0J4Y2_9MICO|nr:family 78 glycoside hydrolase catalytic domain [Leifsonia psychrotolerans]NYJ18576.1 alpha-L-rhamnosidase [Leifsonia psychrotolerans]